MATRIGIELSPTACRIVEIEAPGVWSRRDADLRVRSFTLLPRSGGDTMARLAALKGRQAAVVAWGIRGKHGHATVVDGRYPAMRAEAIQTIGDGGHTRGILSDIAPAGPVLKREKRRPVVLAMASADDVAAAVRPLIAAGIKLRSVVPPAAALGSLARLRRRPSAASVEIYVALDAAATCIAVVRDRVLMAARDLPWGFDDEHEPFGEMAQREEIAIHLADEIADCLSMAGIDLSVVARVCIYCGLPELGSLTAPMMERLGVEIEPLESLVGIDAAHLPAPAEEFRDRTVELRLAWAVAADWAAPLNLLRERRRRAASARVARAAVVAGVGAGLGAGWGLERTVWSEDPARRQTVTRTEVLARSVETPLAPGRRLAPASHTVETMPAARVEPIGTPATSGTPRPPVRSQVAALPVAAVQAVPPPPMRVERTGPLPARQTGVDRRQQLESIAQFDGELGTILFGPDRKLAIINGRIVQAGDEVRGGRVVDITPTSVMLRDETGRLRRLHLGVIGRQTP